MKVIDTKGAYINDYDSIEDQKTCSSAKIKSRSITTLKCTQVDLGVSLLNPRRVFIHGRLP